MDLDIWFLFVAVAVVEHVSELLRMDRNQQPNRQQLTKSLKLVASDRGVKFGDMMKLLRSCLTGLKVIVKYLSI